MTYTHPFLPTPSHEFYGCYPTRHHACPPPFCVTWLRDSSLKTPFQTSASCVIVMFFTRSLTSLQPLVVSNHSSVTYTYRAVYITYGQSFTLLAPNPLHREGTPTHRSPVPPDLPYIPHPIDLGSPDPHKEHPPSPFITLSSPHLISDLPLVVNYIGD